MEDRSWRVLSGSGLLAFGLLVMGGCGGSAPPVGVEGKVKDKEQKEISHAVGWPSPCFIPIPKNYEYKGKAVTPEGGKKYSKLECAEFVDDVRKKIWGDEKTEEWRSYDLPASGSNGSPSAEQIDLILEALYGTGDWLEVYVQHDRNYCNILRQVSATLYGTKPIEDEAKDESNADASGCKIRTQERGDLR
ncbi:hypothetical protein OS176_02530 [Xanthomonadaceae bacterium XH05]|nr:hypothetical protein [Xanthomonadaceae bacterium XH05]